MMYKIHIKKFALNFGRSNTTPCYPKETVDKVDADPMKWIDPDIDDSKANYNMRPYEKRVTMSFCGRGQIIERKCPWSLQTR
jgi:hypothetical protein